MKKLLSILAALGVCSMFAVSNAQAGGVGGHSFNAAKNYSKMLRNNRHGIQKRHHRGKKVIYKKIVKTKYKHGKKIVIVKVIKKVLPRRHLKKFVFKGKKQRRCRPSSYKFTKHHKRPRHKKPGCRKCGGGQPNTAFKRHKKPGGGIMTQNRKRPGGMTNRSRRRG